MLRSILVMASLSGNVAAAATVHEIKTLERPGHPVKVLAERSVERVWRGAANTITVERYPATIVEHAPVGSARVAVYRSRNRQRLRALFPGHPPRHVKALPSDEVRTLVDSGDPANRIDLVFLGDGYTESERSDFFADIERMVDDMFRDETFASYLPVFNVHAVFRASAESGIGRRAPRDTAYGLYRPGDTLRAIYPTRRRAARSACAAAPDCDYPVIVANDPHYGGLGGEFAIATRSPTSGTMVLRHELGHNFGRVGEEYDGGGYFGANHASHLGAISWRHWATQTPITAQPSRARILDWPWHNLARGPWSAGFRSNGQFASAHLRFSVAGLDGGQSLAVEVDGTPLPWTSRGSKDRTFYNFELSAFAAGAHRLTMSENVSDGDNWVASVTLHEYGAEYVKDPAFVGAYPVFDRSGNVAGYRPTHETCLMRDMESRRFCPVCQENNWLRFFRRIRVIDSVTRSSTPDGKRFELHTLALGQHDDGDGHIAVRWFQDGVHQTAWDDQFVVEVTQPPPSAQWRVEATFVTPEVRSDPHGRLSDTATWH